MMNRLHPHHTDHITDLLPAYINGTLDRETQERVHTHLGTCDSCRDDLTEWEEYAFATRTFARSLLTPTLQGDGEGASLRVEPRGALQLPGGVVSQPNGRRPASNRTLRAAQQRKTMQTALSFPYGGARRHQVSRRYAALAATIVILLGLGGIAVWNAPGGSDDPVRLPVAMQVSPEASSVEQCESGDGSIDRIEMTGQTVHESIIELPPGQYEGVPGIEASMLPEGGDPTDAATANNLSETLEGLVACINADSHQGVLGWTSDDYWKRRNALGIETNPERPRGFVSMVSPTGEETILPSIEDARVFPDGRVGAVIRPGFDAPSNSYDYFVFIQKDDRWLVDEAVHVTEWQEVELVVSDDGFSPPEVVVPAGFARLVVRNEGTMTHSMVLPELSIRIEVEPGETGPSNPSSGNIKHPPGSFTFHSDMPGDDPNLFSGTLVIEGNDEREIYPTVDVSMGSLEDQGGGYPTIDASMSSTAVEGEAHPTVEASMGLSPLDPLGVPVASTTITLLPPMEYEPNRVAIIANRDVEIRLVNDPSLSSQGADFLTPVSDAGFEGSPANFTIDALGISVDLEPGESETIVINAPAGVYAFYSTIPGHAEAGMSGTLHVVEEATPAP